MRAFAFMILFGLFVLTVFIMCLPARKQLPSKAQQERCEKCGTMNPPDARFCGQCGVKLVA